MENKFNKKNDKNFSLNNDNNFTFETIKLYKKNIPNAKIIFSTWELPKALERELKELNVSVIVNQKPKNPGIFNINLQIATSKSGILLAKKLKDEKVNEIKLGFMIAIKNIERSGDDIKDIAKSILFISAVSLNSIACTCSTSL